MKENILSTRRFLAAAALGLASALASHASLAVQIDVLVVYDDGVDDHYDGSPLTAIRNMVTTSNTYYRNSDVDIQLNLVGAENINLDSSLSGLATNSTVASLRDATGADFVTLLSNSFGGCGQGYTTVQASRAFNIVKRSCMTHSYVHELGHNMGLGHSVAQDSRGSVHSYGVGWGEDGVFSTVMAYNSAYNVRSRTYKLSNPDVETCNNRPCGRENVADSARAVTNVLDTISNYRQSQSVESGSGDFVSMTKQNAQGFSFDGQDGAAARQGILLGAYNSNDQNQQWEEIDRGNGYYAYKKRGTNHCIDGNNGGANGQLVYLYKCGTNNENQHWKKVNINGRYRLEKRNAPAFSIDGNRRGQEGQEVYLWKSDNANQNQQWIFRSEG